MTMSALLPGFAHLGFRFWTARPSRRSPAPVGPVLRSLSTRSILRLENREQRLLVLKGFVWITRDGCPVDMVLGAGDTFDQQPGAPVLVQALEDAEISIAQENGRHQNA